MPSSMQLRCLEKTSKVREKVQGTSQRSTGGLPPRKQLATRALGGRIRRPTRREELIRRRREALQQSVASTLEADKENITPSGDDNSSDASDAEPVVHDCTSDDLIKEFLGDQYRPLEVSVAPQLGNQAEGDGDIVTQPTQSPESKKTK